MRTRSIVVWLLLGALPAGAGTVELKATEAKLAKTSSATPADKLLAPGNPSFVLDLIDSSTESVIQVRSPLYDACYGGGLFFNDSSSGIAGPAACP